MKKIIFAFLCLVVAVALLALSASLADSGYFDGPFSGSEAETSGGTSSTNYPSSPSSTASETEEYFDPTIGEFYTSSDYYISNTYGRMISESQYAQVISSGYLCYTTRGDATYYFIRFTRPEAYTSSQFVINYKTYDDLFNEYYNPMSFSYDVSNWSSLAEIRSDGSDGSYQGVCGSAPYFNVCIYIAEDVSDAGALLETVYYRYISMLEGRLGMYISSMVG